MDLLCFPAALYFIDATTMAICAPTLVLIVLILAAAISKEYWVLQPHALALVSAHASHEPFRDERIRHTAAQAGIYFGCLLLANLLTAIFLSHINLLPRAAFFDFETYLYVGLAVVGAASTKAMLFTLPLFIALKLYSRKNASVTPRYHSDSLFRQILSVLIFLTIAMYVVPLTQMILAYAGVLHGDSLILRDALRVSIALSTMPSSLIGMVIACSGYRRTLDLREAGQFLHHQSLAAESLNQLSEEHLHKITAIAARNHNFEAAEILSKHLLERADRA